VPTSCYQGNLTCNNIININSELYNGSIIGIELDINELQEFCNMAVHSHVKEVMSVIITKLTHGLAVIKHKFKPRWTDILADRSNIQNKLEQSSI
jgi:hypothetical protein